MKSEGDGGMDEQMRANGGIDPGEVMIEYITMMAAKDIAQKIVENVDCFAENDVIMKERRKSLYLHIIDELRKEIAKIDGEVVVSE